MSEELWMTCQRNPKWAAKEIDDLRAALEAWETNFKRQAVMLKNSDDMLKTANAELAAANNRYGSALADSIAKSAAYNYADEQIADYKKLVAELARVEQATIERCAKVCENTFGGPSRKVSESSHIYQAQDHACAMAARRIRALAAEDKEKKT